MQELLRKHHAPLDFELFSDDEEPEALPEEVCFPFKSAIKKCENDK